MNQGSRLTVMAHFDFFAAMAMGGPPIAISGLKNKCAIPECPQLACDPSGGVRRTPFYTYRCTFWDSDPARCAHGFNLSAADVCESDPLLPTSRPPGCARVATSLLIAVLSQFFVHLAYAAGPRLARLVPRIAANAARDFMPAVLKAAATAGQRAAMRSAGV